MIKIIGKKIGMTNIYNKKGHNLTCTIIETKPCIIIQKKNKKKDGYNAIQIGYDKKKIKNTTKPLLGHFKKFKIIPQKKIIEFKIKNNYYNNFFKTKNLITIEKFFKEGDYINITGKSKGKGFQGVVKRHNFSGVGQKSHGQHNRERAPGSIGGCSYPAKVFKGMKMAGRMGNNYIKILNLQLIKIIKKKNIVLVKGSVPGIKKSYLILEKNLEKN